MLYMFVYELPYKQKFSKGFDFGIISNGCHYNKFNIAYIMFR